MSTGKPLPLRKLLDGPDSPIERLLQHRAALDTQTANVRRTVPEVLRPHILAARLHGETLVVTVDSAVWAARMRFHAPQVLTSLGAIQGPAAQSLRVRVARRTASGTPGTDAPPAG